MSSEMTRLYVCVYLLVIIVCNAFAEQEGRRRPGRVDRLFQTDDGERRENEGRRPGIVDRPYFPSEERRGPGQGKARPKKARQIKCSGYCPEIYKEQSEKDESYCKLYVEYIQCRQCVLGRVTSSPDGVMYNTKTDSQVLCLLKSGMYDVFVGTLVPKFKPQLSESECGKFQEARHKLKKQNTVTTVNVLRENNIKVILTRLDSSFRHILKQDGEINIRNIDCGKKTFTFMIVVQTNHFMMNETSRMLFFEQSLRRDWADMLYELLPAGITVKLNQVDCPPFVWTDSETGIQASFNRSFIKESVYSSQKCPSEDTPMVSAECLGDYDTGASLGKFDVSDDCQVETTYTTESAITSKVRDVLDKYPNDTSTSGMISLTKELDELIDDPEDLVPSDVSAIADALDRLKQSENLPLLTLTKLLGLIDALQRTDSDIVEEAELTNTAASRVIKAKELLLLNANLHGETSERIVTESGVFEIWDLDSRTDVVIGLTSNASSGQHGVTPESRIRSIFDNSSQEVPIADASILLPSEIITGLMKSRSAGTVRLVLTVSNNSALFKHRTLKVQDVGGATTEYTLNSDVISATLSVNGSLIRDLDGRHVQTVFSEKTKFEGGTPKCVYWDTTTSRGFWSTEGCFLNRTMDGYHQCSCNHLTHFAVLMDMSGAGDIAADHVLALRLITYIGLGVSILAVTLTIASFILIKKLRKGTSQQTLLNLCIALLCSWVVFLAGINRTEYHSVCLTVAILLHYFILVSFMWMLVEGVLQYLRFVVVLGTYIPKFTLKAGIISWCVPLIPIVVVLSIDYELYSGRDNFCWMSKQAFYFAFAIPVGVIILVNALLYCVVMWKIFNRPKGLHSNQKESKLRLLNVKAAVSIFLLLGLTWVFGYFTLSDGRIAFNYIFTILNVFQGLYLFLLFIAKDTNFKLFWRNKLCSKCLGEKTLSGSKLSNTYSAGAGATSRRNSRPSTKQTSIGMYL